MTVMTDDDRATWLTLIIASNFIDFHRVLFSTLHLANAFMCVWLYVNAYLVADRTADWIRICRGVGPFNARRKIKDPVHQHFSGDLHRVGVLWCWSLDESDRSIAFSSSFLLFSSQSVPVIVVINANSSFGIANKNMCTKICRTIIGSPSSIHYHFKRAMRRRSDYAATMLCIVLNLRARRRRWHSNYTSVLIWFSKFFNSVRWSSLTCFQSALLRPLQRQFLS